MDDNRIDSENTINAARFSEGQRVSIQPPNYNEISTNDFNKSDDGRDLVVVHAINSITSPPIVDDHITCVLLFNNRYMSFCFKFSDSKEKRASADDASFNKKG